MNYSLIVILLAIAVMLTNFIVQIVKSFSGLKEKPTKLITTIVAIVLCVCSVVAYCQIKTLPIQWYTILASIIVGFVVAYGAIFGFDNLYGQFLDRLKEVLTANKKE